MEEQLARKGSFKNRRSNMFSCRCERSSRERKISDAGEKGGEASVIFTGGHAHTWKKVVLGRSMDLTTEEKSGYSGKRQVTGSRRK